MKGASLNMTEIIGIRFKEVGKVYYFSPNKTSFSAGDKVIVTFLDDEVAPGAEIR